MQKAILRKEALAQRKVLTEAQFAAINQNLLQQFIRLDFSGIASIHVFLPIVKNHEPDTFLFINWLQENHPKITIAVSRANFADYSMSVHPYLGKADLATNNFQIPEPQTNQVYNEPLSMVLVPLLAFDTFGYRVGYGKGFYDRFLTGKAAVKVGISLFEAVERIDDVHPDDIKLDYCLSPKQIYSFVKAQKDTTHGQGF